MNTTKILGEAVGIQRQDIIDRTEEQTADGLIGAIILGRFKRGRVDAPMEIHQGNIRGQLGYDPKNPDYIAVQDCLDTGVPSVQVLRLKPSIAEGSSNSDYIMISPDFQYENETPETKILWSIEVDGVSHAKNIGWSNELESYLYIEDYFRNNKKTLGITAKYIADDENNSGSGVCIYNITDKRKFVRLIPSIPYVSTMNMIRNDSVVIDSSGVVSFWLNPKSGDFDKVCTPTHVELNPMSPPSFNQSDFVGIHISCDWQDGRSKGNIRVYPMKDSPSFNTMLDDVLSWIFSDINIPEGCKLHDNGSGGSEAALFGYTANNIWGGADGSYELPPSFDADDYKFTITFQNVGAMYPFNGVHLWMDQNNTSVNIHTCGFQAFPDV